MNTLFTYDDLNAKVITGYSINDGWWSRFYEYPWALRCAVPDMIVADMGCGYEFRPFKNALARICKKVYAVDRGTEILMQGKSDNLEFVVADFTQRIPAIQDESLDAVFCISVLEDLGDRLPFALQEFYRCLKVGGVCVITCDVQYDMNKPVVLSPAVDMDFFKRSAEQTGFISDEWRYSERKNVVYHEALNLCVFHCVLVKP